MRGILVRAAEGKQVLEMIYQDCEGNISQRNIKVLSIGNESFRAYCYIKKQQRTFKFSGVLSIGSVRKRKIA